MVRLLRGGSPRNGLRAQGLVVFVLSAAGDGLGETLVSVRMLVTDMMNL